MWISHKNENLHISQNGDGDFMNYDKLETLAKARGVSKTYLCQIVGRERYYLRDCKKNSFVPPREHIEAWAASLGTTVEYLTDQTDDPIPKNTDELLALLERLCVEDRKSVLTYVKELLARES